LNDVLHYYSEAAPCGAIGSFILDKEENDTDSFTFKHHYITSAMDSDVLSSIFLAMREKSVITVKNFSRKTKESRENRVIPLRVFISVQNGRQYLLAYHPDFNTIKSFRIDYLSEVKIIGTTPRFDELRTELDKMQTKMWGVTGRRNLHSDEAAEYVEFTVRIADNEEYIIRRLEREKRIGTVERINRNLYRFSAEVYDISEHLCECMLEHEAIWEEKGIEIETDIEEELYVEADKELLSLVWNNLFSNALKFTEPGGMVSLHSYGDENYVYVEVKDTGCGMTPETGANIFKKFYQGDTSHSTKGNGLGLALVKRVIDICKGEISVSSRLGQGSTFTVRLNRTKRS